jgi:hypothetical protein
MSKNDGGNWKGWLFGAIIGALTTVVVAPGIKKSMALSAEQKRVLTLFETTLKLEGKPLEERLRLAHSFLRDTPIPLRYVKDAVESAIRHYQNRGDQYTATAIANYFKPLSLV